MAYDLPTVRNNVRALIPNITQIQYNDARLAVLVASGLRRVNAVVPNRKSVVLVGAGASYYNLLTAFTDWVTGVSSINKIAAPAPVLADDDLVTYLGPGRDWSVFNNGTSDYLFLTRGLTSAETAVVEHTTPWTVSGTDAAVLTTLPIRYQDALEFITAALLCYALSSQAAGTQSSSIPGDLLNYHNQEREYRSAGQNWEAQFEKVLGIGKNNISVAAVMKRGAYNTQLQNGSPRMTHR